VYGRDPLAATDAQASGSSSSGDYSSASATAYAQASAAQASNVYAGTSACTGGKRKCNRCDSNRTY